MFCAERYSGSWTFFAWPANSWIQADCTSDEMRAHFTHTTANVDCSCGEASVCGWNSRSSVLSYTQFRYFKEEYEQLISFPGSASIQIPKNHKYIGGKCWHENVLMIIWPASAAYTLGKGKFPFCFRMVFFFLYFKSSISSSTTLDSFSRLTKTTTTAENPIFEIYDARAIFKKPLSNQIWESMNIFWILVKKSLPGCTVIGTAYMNNMEDSS